MSTASLRANRVGTILRKDLRLLWPLAALSVLLQVVLGFVKHHSTPFNFGNAHMALLALLTLVLVVSMVLVIIIAVQQDPVPGSSQDWVVRPIRRRDMLLAKLAIVGLLIHGPILVVQIVQALSEGFRFGQILPAALLSNFEIALLFTLPVMAVATMTRTVGEALVGSIAVVVGFILAYVLIMVVHDAVAHTWVLEKTTQGTGVQWVWQSLSHVWLLAFTIVVLLLQYFRRLTLHSRVLFVGGLFLFTLSSYLPWQPAFALQERLGSAPVGRVSMVFAANAASAHSGAALAATGALLENELPRIVIDGKTEAKLAPGLVRIVLPIQVSGLGVGAILHGDRAAFRLSDAHGTVYRGVGHTFDLQVASDGSALLGQVIDVPQAVYAQAAHRRLRLAMDYSLTILHARALSSLPVPGAGRLPGLGRCADRIDANGKALDVACMTVGAEPPCLSMSLTAGGVGQGRRTFHCQVNYEPSALRFSVDPIVRFQSKLPLSTPDTAGSPPTSPRGTRVRFMEYEPQAHFSREVLVRGLQLADWRQRTGRQSANPPSTSTGESSGHS